MKTNEQKKSGALTAGFDQSPDNYAAEKNELQIESLNRKNTQEILSKIQKLKNKPGEQKLHVLLDSTGGYLSYVKKILDLVKPGSKVQLITKASGSVKPAGVVLAAGGMYGSRKAEFGTKFILTNGKPYPIGSKARDLSDEDKNTLKALTGLTVKRTPVLRHMLKGRSISADEAKKCGIIDEVEIFPKDDWTKEKRIKYANTSGENKPIEMKITNADVKTDHLKQSVETEQSFNVQEPDKTVEPGNIKLTDTNVQPGKSEQFVNSGQTENEVITKKTEQPEETGQPISSELPPVNEQEKTGPNQIENI